MGVSNFKCIGEARAWSFEEGEHQVCKMIKEGFVWVLLKKFKSCRDMKSGHVATWQ